MEKSGNDSRDTALGCGSNVSTPITLHITTTTGGSFSVSVEVQNSVENLKKIISKKLKVSKDRICLLHRERELHDGTLKENGLFDGSKLILTPNVETGLLAQRAENTVMQALEALNDNQVNDFLSGKSPLNLSVRLGDHMMLIQLQLSTLNPSSTQRIKSSRTRITPTTYNLETSSRTRISTSNFKRRDSDSLNSSHVSKTLLANDVAPSTSTATTTSPSADLNNYLTTQEIENIHSIVKSLTEAKNTEEESAMETDSVLDQSPIKSLSNLVSSPINTSITDPISANLTSCLCKRLDSNDNSAAETNCQMHNEPSAQSSLHRTAQNPIARHKNKLQSLKKTMSLDSSLVKEEVEATAQTTTSASAPTSASATPEKLDSSKVVTTPESESDENPALAEASRNLTQTLRKLSKRVFTNKVAEVVEEKRNVSSGAVIESMKHHGKGIYSGTFSGTLNPALQDKFGRPKRDISTIIHILNDLLSAAPQCARPGTKIYFEPAASSSKSSSLAGSSSKTAVRNITSIKRHSSSQTPSGTSCAGCKSSDASKSAGNCIYGKCDGHVSAAKQSTTSSATIPNNMSCTKCSTDSESASCQCNTTTVIDTTELENSKTKHKLENLRLIMQQKKERREARKINSLPYTTSNTNKLTATTPSPSISPAVASAMTPSTSSNVVNSNSNIVSTATSSPSITIASSSSDAPNHLVEEVETVA